jgi:hypothetical protein
MAALDFSLLGQIKKAVVEGKLRDDYWVIKGTKI